MSETANNEINNPLVKALSGSDHDDDAQQQDHDTEGGDRDRVDDTPAEGEDHADDADQDDAEGTDDDGAEDGPLKAARREASKHRRKLRETEAELTETRDKLTAHEWAEVGRNLAVLKSVEPLQKLGHQLDEFRAEDGSIDPAKVQDISTAAADDLGIKRRHPIDGLDRQPELKPQATWQGLLNSTNTR